MLRDMIKSKARKNNLQKAVVVGVFILLALLLFNLFNTFGLKSMVENKIAEMKELARQPRLELTVIKVNCDDCFDIDEAVSTLKDSDVNITSELTLDSSSKEAKALIEKYGVEKLPIIILMGEINKIPIQNFKQGDGALIFDAVTPPYVNAETGKVMGKVSAVIIIDKDCEVCIDFDTTIQALKRSNVVFSEVKQIDFGSLQAEEFITKYEIKRISSLLLSKDINVYEVAQDLERAGFQLKKDYYVIESPAPYVETNTSKLRGLVTLTMITDDSCQECYDVTLHKQILAGYGLAIQEEKTLDIGSSGGKDLLEKYDITKVPTMILSGDVAVYENLNSVWKQVGTIEDDGAYVFRGLSAIKNAVYKDLSTNEIVK